MKPLLTLLLLVVGFLVIVIAAYWPTYHYATDFSADDHEKITKGALSLLGAFGLLFAAWAKFFK